jgi:WD40 repeat protein
MPLAAGTRLGPYEIRGVLGAGGMGVVYRARDTRLERDVAVKVLPEAFADDPDRLRRFEQEARAVAALNHPHIVTIHDVGTHQGAPFVVTELLEGETLREVLTHRAPSQRQLLEVAAQAADGLAAAHRKGLVHRDLKPENLFLTTDGRLKILDFGLATHVRGHGADAERPTETHVSTPGVVVGTAAYMAPEQVQAKPVDVRADVFAFGVVLYELLARRHPFLRPTLPATLTAIVTETPPELSTIDRTIPPAVAGVVRRCLEKAREDRYPSAHELAVALEAVRQAPSGAASLQDVEERSPYPGLHAFTEQDAAVFVGREAEVAALWARIRAQRLLAVIGPSGTGKTSFIRAGVIPARPDGWAAMACTPGTAPLRGLGQALGPALANDAEALSELAGFEEPATALRLLRRWRAAHAEALVIVDQFEELFTLNAPEAQERFAAFLGQIVEEADVHVVLSLRDDFLMRCHAHAALAPVFSDLTPLGPLTRENLARALVEPATKRGYRFEDGPLVGEMVDAVEGARSALPLLAFAVSRTWERRDRERKVLTRAAYEDLGGVAGALAQHAEATMERLGPARHDLVREIFRHLVTAQGTRAVIDRDELLSAFADRAAADEVLRALVDARLLTSYEVEGKPGEPSRHPIEIVHESLLQAWPRLVRWQTQDEDSAQVRDQLKQAAHLWDEKGRSADLLWTGTAFQEFELWRQRYQGTLTSTEAEFARAMAERARRRRRVRRAAVAAVIVALSGVAIAIGVSRQQAVAGAERAEAEAKRAEASRLVALGRLELDRYPTATVAYARRSLEIADTEEARLLAVEALWRGPTARIHQVPETGYCSRVAFSPDGRYLACSGFSDKVFVWDQAGRVAHVFENLARTAEIREVAFSPEGNRLISWVRGDPRLSVWSLPTGVEVAFDAWAELVPGLGLDTLETFGPGRPGDASLELRRWVLSSGQATTLARWTLPAGLRLGKPGMRPLAVDPGFRWVAFGHGASVVLSRLGGTAPARRFERHRHRVREVAFDGAGSHLLSVDESGLLCLWSVADGLLHAELQSVPPHRYSIPVVNANGSVVTWTSGDGTTRIWKPQEPAHISETTVQRVPSGDVGSQVLSPDGRWLATAEQGSLALWSLGHPTASRLVAHVEGPMWDLAFSPDSQLLASCTRDGVILWPINRAGGSKRRVSMEADGYCFGVRFTPDGRHLAVQWHNLGAYLVPVDGGPARRVMDSTADRSPFLPLVFDREGTTLATATAYAAANAEMLLRVVHLASGLVRNYPLRSEVLGFAADPYNSSGHFLRYQADGRLLIAGFNGIRRWDPSTEAVEPLVQDDRLATLDTDATGHTVVAVLGKTSSNRTAMLDPEIVVLDDNGQPARKITTHGDLLTWALAVDASGRILATGDALGVVRVGPVSGASPHVLARHRGPVERVAISPDGKWIASAAGTDIRLWPMPDLAKRPFHTLPYDDVMAKLRALTNLRVVDDPTSASGYKLEIGPFPGWKDVPTW